MTEIFISHLQTPLGLMSAICDKSGLLRLDWSQEALDDADLSASSNDVSRETISQLTAYLSGKLRGFSLPISDKAASASLLTWMNVIASVPYGQTVSYKALAGIWGNEKASRAAGNACQRNPIPIIIPCHRILGSSGQFDRYSGGDRSTPTDPANIARKKALLDLEAGLKSSLL